MTSLQGYLSSGQAVLDAASCLTRCFATPAFGCYPISDNVLWEWRAAGKWTNVGVYTGRVSVEVYFRPLGGGRYCVTDCGKTIVEYRVQTGDAGARWEDIDIVGAFDAYGAPDMQITWVPGPVLEDLPRTVCKVLLVVTKLQEACMRAAKCEGS